MKSAKTNFRTLVKFNIEKNKINLIINVQSVASTHHTLKKS